MLALPVEMYDANFSNVEKICLDIGCYFQVQDDFIDCFGDDKVTGKIGTDIQDGKCSWFIVQALAHASETQKKFLHKNYGTEDSVSQIRSIFNELDLKNKYHTYQSLKRTQILSDIA